MKLSDLELHLREAYGMGWAECAMTPDDNGKVRDGIMDDEALRRKSNYIKGLIAAIAGHLDI
jgi:hypothetical protein